MLQGILRNPLTSPYTKPGVGKRFSLGVEAILELEPDLVYYGRRIKLHRYLVTIESKEAIDKKSAWNVLSEFSGKVEGPKDWSQEHDHYLYGVPKREK